MRAPPLRLDSTLIRYLIKIQSIFRYSHIGASTMNFGGTQFSPYSSSSQGQEMHPRCFSHKYLLTSLITYLRQKRLVRLDLEQDRIWFQEKKLMQLEVLTNVNVNIE